MIIARAPLRVSFFGGGTDFPEYFSTNGGAVLASAITKYSYVTASRFESQLFDYALRVSYSKGELVRNPADIQHPVFRAALDICGIAKDLELHTVADLPAFTGLGSSSAFTVALLQALHAYKHEYVAPITIAREAIHIERDLLRENVGYQDQVTAAVGGFNLLEFRRHDEVTVRPLCLRPERTQELENSMLLIYTGIKRRASELEGKKLEKIALNIPALNSLKEMAYKGIEILQSDRSMEEFGRLLNKGWEIKKSLESSVSNAEIDALYNRAIQAGAWGGKLLGAGGGGFLLFLVPSERRAAVTSKFPEHPAIPASLGAAGVGVIFGS